MLNPKLEQIENSFNVSSLCQINSPLLEQKHVELWLKRDDLIDPVISGNKWRKLKFILNHALALNSQTIISMGGAYSNHLHALAYVAKTLNLNSIAYIRGEQPENFSPTLKDIQHWGMQLRFVSRSEYRELRSCMQYNQYPATQTGEYWLPEVGSTELALLGVAEIIAEIDMDYDHLCVPCGTGTTLAGLINAAKKNVRITGFSALKGGGYLKQEVEHLLFTQSSNWSINLDYHFGGFAKTNNTLFQFMESFYKLQGIALEPVYTGKMLYALFDLISKDQFKPGEKIIAIHTGGLQGHRDN